VETFGLSRRLTSFSHGAGCGCKLGPDDLRTVLGTLVLPPAPDEVVVAADTGDDAAVYRLPSGETIVATLDFFTPIVDDPYDWGRIAATNAMSDIYAMAGRPFLGLNIVSWPVDDLPTEMLGRVLQGGVDAAASAGVAIVGGHSITDPEPKYGMVVLGTVTPDRIVRNSTAVVGAALVLTKPLGLGIASTAVKRGVAADDLIRKAVELMTTSNAEAANAMWATDTVAGTDVTGFGLLGHLHRMLLSSGVAATLDASAVPLFDPRVLQLATGGVVPSGTRRNHAFVAPHTDFGTLPEAEQMILADAQTSGGLLVATTDPDALIHALDDRHVPSSVVGHVVAGDAGRMEIRGRLSRSAPGLPGLAALDGRE
jgi:selenide,water dikinase